VERVWKYVALLLTVLLLLSVTVGVVLYQQVSVPTVTEEQVTLNVTCPVGDDYQLREEIAYLRSLINGTTEGKVAIVPIFGIITDYTALEVIPLLRGLAANDSIGGVLLWIESPGGEVGPVIQIYSEVRKLSLIKPVVAYSGGIMASGGYYIAVGADKIVANPLAEVGSIGVIYVHYNLEENYQMNGVKVEVFKTGPYKDMGAEWRGLTEEEKRMVIEVVNTYFQAFLQAVSEGRNMNISTVRDFATGRTWFAKNVTGTLVDETGGIDTALEVLEGLMNVSGAETYIYRTSVPEYFPRGSRALYLDPDYLGWLNAL